MFSRDNTSPASVTSWLCPGLARLAFSVSLVLLPFSPLWRAGSAVYAQGTSVNMSEVNLGESVTRIVVDNNNVFVGGTNFVALLSTQLILLYRFRIGPVYEAEYCWPQSAPCDNTVRVLEIDYEKKLLLVCGSAYQGTCTLHQIVNIFDNYYCLNGQVMNSSSPQAVSQQPSPGVLAPVRAGDSPAFTQIENSPTGWMEEEAQDVPETVVLFLKKRRARVRSEAGASASTPCRAYPFGEPAFLEPTRPLRTSRDTGVGGFSTQHDFSSILLVAGVVNFPGNDTAKSGMARESPLPLSVREIMYFDLQYSISYAPGRDLDTPQGYQLAPRERLNPNFYLDYKLIFSQGKFTYLVFLQNSTCKDGKPCVETRIGRICHDSPTLSPYVDVEISCKHDGKVYHLLTSVVLGHVNIRQQRSHVLVVGFGARKKDAPGARRADARQGGAVCMFTLDKIDKEMEFAVEMCNRGVRPPLSVPPSWIKQGNSECLTDRPTPDDVCSSTPVNPYVQSLAERTTDAIMGFSDTGVASLWSYTPRQNNVQSDDKLLSQRMSLFILTLDGRISKITLTLKMKENKITASPNGIGISEFHKLDITLTNENGTWNGQPIPVGTTHDSTAFMYILIGTKVMYLSLDYCRQFHSCDECMSHNSLCKWCPAERACRGEDTTGPLCKTSESNICPPKLHLFRPVAVPYNGGSVLALYGSHIGMGEDEMNRVKVVVCDQECDNVTSASDKDNQITCILRGRCDDCPQSCKVKVSVERREKTFEVKNNFRLEYVTPEVTGFSPSYGPMSGHTTVTLSGRHLDSGNEAKVKVAGIDCEVSLKNRWNLYCQLLGESGAMLRCGSVELSIDNFHTFIPDAEFCLRKDPQIRKITPTQSIESGGITITIEGSNLDSATSAAMVLSLAGQDQSHNVVRRFTSLCTRLENETEVMTCLSPPIKDLLGLQAELSEKKSDLPPEVRHLTFQLQVDMDGRNVLENSTEVSPRPFVVHKDPTIFRYTTNSDDAFIDIREPVVNIRGNNVPTWLPFSNIIVTIGNWTCPVIKVDKRLISCDAAEIAGHVLDLFFTEATPNVSDLTTSDPDGSLFTFFNVSEGESPTDGEMNSSLSTEVTRYSEGNFTMTTTYRSPTTPTVAPLRKERGSLVSDIKELSSSDQALLERDHETVPTTMTTISNFSIEFKVQIKIGSLKLDLGVITIGYDKSRTTTPSTSAPETEQEFQLRQVAGPIAAGALILLLIAAIVLGCQLVKTRRRTRKMEKMAPYYMGSISGSGPGSKELAIPTLKDILESIMEPSRRSEVDNLIIKLDRLNIGKSIGSGNFGCVYEGLLELEGGQPPQRVAVKTLQDDASQSLDLKSFVQEAVLMKDFRHPHVLGLVGLSERAGPTGCAPYVILPYMENGDLLTYVRDTHVTISLHDVIKFGADIASGMAYLSGLKFVHRDLAARNCMLDSLHRAKVADFGLCRDIYEKGYYTSDNRKKLPIRWMAVESIEHGAYSSKSDVWSFGVVLWELSCRGVTPYPGVDGWDVINYLRKRRLAPPFFCPDELYNIMMLCWAKDPDKRPDFPSLHADLLGLIGQTPSAMLPIAVRRRASEGFSPTPSPTSPGPAHFKLPEVVGPLGRRAMQMRKSNSDVEKGLDQPNNSPYKNIAAIEEDATKAAVEKTRLSASSVGDGNGAAGDSGVSRRSSVTVVVTGPPKAAIKNVSITIPTCFQHRDLSRSTAAEYITLVDNYEPAPKFSSSIKLKSRRSKKSGWDSDTKDRESVEKRNKKPPVAPRSSKTKSGASEPAAVNRNPSAASGYSTLVFDHRDGSRGSGGSGRMVGVSYGVKLEGNYFELETAGGRFSAVSDGVSGRQSGRSSLNTGSVASLIDNRSGRASSSPSASRASAASSRASTPGVLRSSHSPVPGSNGKKSSNIAKQLPVVEQLKTGSGRLHEESSVIDDEISSCFETDL